MTTIGVTGHIRLLPSARPLIFQELVSYLRRFRPVHGVTCLADGSDQLFAGAVRACHGTFDVVLPGAAAPPRHLLRQAGTVDRVEVRGTAEAAYEAASRAVVERCDILVAVWDGDAMGGRGGTAETVEWALARGRQVVRIWPEGALRTPPVTVPVG